MHPHFLAVPQHMRHRSCRLLDVLHTSISRNHCNKCQPWAGNQGCTCNNNYEMTVSPHHAHVTIEGLAHFARHLDYRVVMHALAPGSESREGDVSIQAHMLGSIRGHILSPNSMRVAEPRTTYHIFGLRQKAFSNGVSGVVNGPSAAPGVLVHDGHSAFPLSSRTQDLLPSGQTSCKNCTWSSS